MSARRKTRIVCISDTHNQTPKLPAGDVLIHAGDLTNQGSYAELKRTVEWLERQEFEAKIVVAGTECPWSCSRGTDIMEKRSADEMGQGITTLRSILHSFEKTKSRGNGLRLKTQKRVEDC